MKKIKKRLGRGRITKAGYVRYSVLMHERYVRAIDSLVNSETGIRRRLTKKNVVHSMATAYFEGLEKEDVESQLGVLKETVEEGIGALESEIAIVTEIVIRFIKVFLGVTAPVPPSERDKAEAQSHARFAQFEIGLLAALQNGRGHLRRFSEELYKHSDENAGIDGEESISTRNTECDN